MGRISGTLKIKFQDWKKVLLHLKMYHKNKFNQNIYNFNLKQIISAFFYTSLDIKN